MMRTGLPAESRMSGNAHVRFGGAGRGDLPSETAAWRLASTLLIELGSRRVHVAGVTARPDSAWVTQHELTWRPVTESRGPLAPAPAQTAQEASADERKRRQLEGPRGRRNQVWRRAERDRRPGFQCCFRPEPALLSWNRGQPTTPRWAPTFLRNGCLA